ncbi:predicted protein [Aspergillus nidulans FGSC A4]|uniref:Uncharacterized protein n=1 Tax=Emericella nidulans (strain FGSC A4 / ATCC 38163 / CBS 112.46 / NRRL 194 / M139) TaxID=227321 RepID=Q5AWL1_EMENI|nr:hypothetical protein [Aspergillus nidulans FGSC A4]EAA61370.1 predicted protein [Aspergillus nidulans FGSC A4]CBF78625.1 TPA: conserved hypothetical protein [Aspergillus nidulans FGSC A4]|eukprot:XP_680588.1 predicted protein [Aspergillus nidulans FGSC A4]
MACDLHSRTLYSNTHSDKTRNCVVRDKEAKCRDAKAHQVVLQRGITGKDLPIVPSGVEDSVLKDYVGLCDAPAPLIVRNLGWRENNAGEPERKLLDNTRQLQAAFAQTHGSLARTPCAPCASRKGSWKTCVTREYLRTGEKKPTNTDCAKCLFDDRQDCCITLTEASTSSRIRRSSAPSPKTLTHDYELPKQNSMCPFKLEVDYAKDCHHKTELSRWTTAPDENGAVLSFPLGVECWDNLPRLKQACSEMEHHLNIAKVESAIRYLKKT